MYNFDAASFPEFNYIKRHMLQNDVSILAKSQSSLVESFLKNFEQGLTKLNENIEKSKSMSQFDSFPITQATNMTDTKEDTSRTGYSTGKLANSGSNKKEASENTMSSGKASSSRLLSIDSLFSRRLAKSGVSKQAKATPVNISSKKVNRSEGNSLISWDLSSRHRDNQLSTSYGDSSFNERSFVEPTSRKTSNSFFNIYRNSQQSHSTGILVTETSAKSLLSKKSLSNGNSHANSKQNSPSPTTSRMATSANGTEKKSHLFDFYSYYNNKYQENERKKKSDRSLSINNPNSVSHHFHRHRENGRANLDDSKNYYITEASQFNMKKFASSL